MDHVGICSSSAPYSSESDCETLLFLTDHLGRFMYFPRLGFGIFLFASVCTEGLGKLRWLCVHACACTVSVNTTQTGVPPTFI